MLANALNRSILCCGLPVVATPGPSLQGTSQATRFQKAVEKKFSTAFFMAYPYVYPSWTRGLSSEQAGIDRINQVKCDNLLMCPKF